MTFEVLPAIELADFKSLKLERLVADVDAEAVDKAVGELVERNVTFTPEEGRAAENGDRVTVDFVGKIDGEAFEGGTAEGAPIVLGQGNFIPGFEEGIAGAKAGDERDVVATFPADYPVADAGRQRRELRRQGEGSGVGRASARSTTTSPRRSAPKASPS